MEILIVTHYFPPMNSIASLRPYSWAKFWTKAGHNVTVLTTKKGRTEIDLNLPNQGFNVIEVHSKASRNIKKGNEKSASANTVKNKKNWLRKKISNYCIRTGALLHDARYPNLFMFWKKPAVETVIKSGNHFDVAIATFAPFASFMIAFELKKRKIVDKTVLDFRDLWIDNHLCTGVSLFSSYEKKLEKKMCSLADKITVVSDSLADVLCIKYDKNKINVIFNGFDTDDIMDLPQDQYFDNEKINIAFTGSFYADLVNPHSFFKAIKQLKDECVFGIDRLRVYFAGARVEQLIDIVYQYGLESTILCMGFVPREDALRMQRDADVLLFLESENAKTDGILTGKLFEYIFSGTPIWTIGKKWKPSRMIEEYGIGKAFGNDVESIKKSLQEVLSGNIPPKYNAMDIPEIQKYTREYQANEMLKVMENVLEK